MRVISLLAITALLIPFLNIYGQTQTELEHRFVPSKLIEGTEGTLHVYIEDTLPRIIDGLVVTSSDPSIVTILGIEQNHDSFATIVNLKAGSEGDAKIALAAPGFLPMELPVTIFPNDDTASQLIMKITPETFSTNGPKEGYVSVELANKDDRPVLADRDIVVDLEASKTDVVSFKDSSLVIKKGEYFSVGEFEIKQSGKTSLIATSASVGTASQEISVDSKASEQRIQSFVYPKIVNNFFSSFAYLVVQLQDSSGMPVIAEEDIPVSVKVTESNQEEPVNSSNRESIVNPSGQLVIKQGSYWGYIKLAVKAGLSGTFDIRISAKDYLVPAAVQLETTLTHTMDDKSARVDLFPVLATGKEELIGIMHLEDLNGKPVISRDDLVVEVDSSDLNTLSVKDVHINRGDSVALVFGKAEKTENQVTLTVVTEDPQTLSPVISLPQEDELSLVAEPLVPKVLDNTDFPIALYFSHSDGAPEYSNIDANIAVSPRESIITEPTSIRKGDAFALLNSKLAKDKPVTLSFVAGEFSAESTIESFGNGPSIVSLNHPEKILSNSNNIFAVELLDEQKFPVFADRDFEIKLVSANPSIVESPQNIIIKKGSYYSVFDMGSKTAGETKLSVLTDGMPLSEVNLIVASLNPEISLSTDSAVEPNSAFNAILLAQHDGQPISGLQVDWNVQGAGIQSIESVTDENGNARISLLSPESGMISLKATTSGGAFTAATTAKDVTVNAIQITPEQTEPQNEFFNIMGLNPIYFVIPAAGGAVFVLKKKGMLEGMTERLDFLAKVSEIKEKILSR